MDTHADRPDDSPHRPYSALRYLLLQRGRRAVAQSRMAVAGGAGFCYAHLGVFGLKLLKLVCSSILIVALAIGISATGASAGCSG